MAHHRAKVSMRDKGQEMGMALAAAHVWAGTTTG